jgi:hypothetical protein
MKKGLIRIAGLSGILLFALLLGCNNPAGDNANNNKTGGTLTIDNLPAGSSFILVIYDYSGNINSLLGLTTAIADPIGTAAAMVTSSPAALYATRGENTTTTAFTKSGTFLVTLTAISPSMILFKTGVSFSGGNASINYNELIDQSTLPTGSGSGGTLTINNFPAGGLFFVKIYNHSGSINNQTELLDAITGTIGTTGSLADSSLVTLYTPSAAAFTQSGTFLVVLRTLTSTVQFKTGVSFSSGNASIDYNELVNQSDLPLTGG